MEALYVDSKEACIWHYCHTDKVNQVSPSHDLNVELTMDCETTVGVPDPLPVIVKRCHRCLPTFTTEEVESINSATIGQADNSVWVEQRLGRVTGSKIHAVHVAAQKIRNNKAVAVSTINSVLGADRDLSNVAAIKYGRQNESVALTHYVTAVKCTGHHLVQPTGLIVSDTDVYIGASPDGLVSCDTCGKGCIEIKCPITAAHTQPCAEVLPYLTYNVSNNTQTLLKTHKYYSQVSHYI